MMVTCIAEHAKSNLFANLHIMVKENIYEMSSDLDAYGSTTDPSHKSHHALVPYFMHRRVTKMYAYVHIHVRKWL